MDKINILIIISVLGVLILALVISSKAGLFSKEQKNCFTPENFDKALPYTKWKQKTSKIGKVLVNSYRVEVNEKEEIVFMNDKNRALIFKVTRNEGIVLLIQEPKKNLLNKANGAFCELLKRALFHPVNP